MYHEQSCVTWAGDLHAGEGRLRPHWFITSQRWLRLNTESIYFPHWPWSTVFDLSWNGSSTVQLSAHFISCSQVPVKRRVVHRFPLVTVVHFQITCTAVCSSYQPDMTHRFWTREWTAWNTSRTVSILLFPICEIFQLPDECSLASLWCPEKKKAKNKHVRQSYYFFKHSHSYYLHHRHFGLGVEKKCIFDFSWCWTVKHQCFNRHFVSDKILLLHF